MTASKTHLLPPGTSAWVFGSGKIGHEVHCYGLARALGVEPIGREVRPRLLFAALSPWGPADPRDMPAPPYPDVAFAAGRLTIPYLRRVKRASGRRTFTVCLQDPRTGPRTADVIWAPEHDRIRGENVIVTLTSPHGLRPDVLATARTAPDPRIAVLAGPRVAMVLGGPSAHHRFEEKDVAALAGAARDLAEAGASVMVTPSRRTPPDLLRAIGEALHRFPGQAFVWDGTGDNPYAQMLANADAVLVTADSANMMGEATATGVPVHAYEPTGGHPKMTAFLERLIAEGYVRRWRGALESWTYAPVDATTQIAEAVAARYAAFRSR